MSKIFTGDHTNEKEFTANQELDTERRKKVTDESMAFVGIVLSVLGNSAGRNKTAGESSLGSTGGSFQALFGSDYCVADLTIPFRWKYGMENQSEISKQISEIQTKLSQNLTDIQGKLTPEEEASLRDSAMRSQAIREAKEEIRTNGDDDFDQNTFNKANASIRANVISDMSLNGGIECSAAVGVNSGEAKKARDRKWKVAKGESGILTFRAKEKGLKSVYLMDAARVQKAQDYVYKIGCKMQEIVDNQLASGWSDEISMNILKQINAAIEKTQSGTIKIVPAYNANELSVIESFKKAIVEKYNHDMNKFEED